LRVGAKISGIGQEKTDEFFAFWGFGILTAEFLIIDLRRKTRKKFLMT
jgi:hypothetical protein